ncbi:MAG: peptidoglycan DD-metalloendopeptidase family protein [Firmicutes bacterium]|nr:peptidoglycan DD-metalloendopeptidase family protein [Candidatus Fermentithermobacillaceae bacterium]
MLARLFGRQSRPVGKMAASSRERRFTFLVVYSHGKTHRMSFSLTALVSVLALACISLVALGAFVNSYIRTSKENQELNYLYDVAGIQEMQIQYLQERLRDISERLRQAELVESETRTMLLEEGLIEEGVSEMAATVAARQVMAETTSRSGRNISRIPPRDMALALESLEQAAFDLDGEIASLDQRLTDLRERAEEAVAYSRARPSIWPVQGSITSVYGWRRHPITGRQQLHEGLDIGASYRAPIRAAADGTVKFAGYEAGYGWCVRIAHGYGFETVYCHCSSVAVKAGQQVKRGDIIAYVGSSGTSTGPHLHYEVLKDGKNQDPMDYLPK